MTDEPPAKRAKRTDSAAMWEKNETAGQNASSSRLSRPHASDREKKAKVSDDNKGGGHVSGQDDHRRKRSRSPRDKHERRKRSRSRSPREKSHKEKDKIRDRDGNRVKEDSIHRERRRSRSREKHKSSKDHKSDRKRDRSRSPYRNGESATSVRQRSPPRSRVKHEERDSKDLKDIKPAVNGAKKEAMDIDDDDIDIMMKKMMGFSSFKTTQNTKVPGNQIYGVRKEKKTEYRQYMNRVGGFNRPLSPG